MQGLFPLVPGLPGGPELIIVLFVLVLLFGANKIPKLARSTGQAMGEFRKGRQEVEEELEEMPGESVGAEETGSTTTATDTDGSETETAEEKSA
ncbi:MAG: twin-arginine translocase TatA/TatE family subunit [Haloferacaceae archaeon]